MFKGPVGRTRQVVGKTEVKPVDLENKEQGDKGKKKRKKKGDFKLIVGPKQQLFSLEQDGSPKST